MRKHATGGWLYAHSGPGGAAERYGDADSWSAGAGGEDSVRSKLLPPPAKVLEVGCGSGELALAFSGGGWRVTAVDPEAPEGEPFVRAAVEELGAVEYEPFDAAVTVLPLHHAGNVGLVLDKVRSLLKPGGVLVVDEFRKEHLADEATAAFYYHQRLSLLHSGRKETGGGGHQPSGGHLSVGGSFESWYARVSEHRAGVHDEGKGVWRRSKKGSPRGACPSALSCSAKASTRRWSPWSVSSSSKAVSGPPDCAGSGFWERSLEARRSTPTTYPARFGF